MKVIESNSIGFTRPCDFNDPFELSSAVCSEESSEPFSMLAQMSKESSYNFFWERPHQWRNKACILSLTRQPLNSLMWSHYCDGHSGMVIGIDCSGKQFTSKNSNIVPVQFGNVIYSSSKPKNEVFYRESERSDDFNPFHFPANNLERLQRMFLYKDSQWVYEEEVRVVKYLGSKFPTMYELRNCGEGEDASTKTHIELLNRYFEPGQELHGIIDRVIELSERPLFLLSLPLNAIKEIYVGARSSIIQSGGAGNAIDFSQKVKIFQPKAEIFGCYVEDDSWSIKTFNIAERLSNKN
jgi:hypothetical protein